MTKTCTNPRMNVTIENWPLGFTKHATTFVRKDRVRLLAARPLPSGKLVWLIGLVDFFRPDGLIEIRISTPGLYSGGIFIVSADEIEKIT